MKFNPRISRVEFYRRLTSATLSAACLLLVREITDRGGEPQIVVMMTGDNDINNVRGLYSNPIEATSIVPTQYLSRHIHCDHCKHQIISLYYNNLNKNESPLSKCYPRNACSKYK